MTKGPAIAQFLGEVDLCSKCYPITKNKFLISKLCIAYGAAYILKIIEMSHEGTKEVRRVPPGNLGNLSKQGIKQSLVYHVKIYKHVRGYDSQAGAFTYVGPPQEKVGKKLVKGLAQHELRLPQRKGRCDDRGELWKKGPVPR